MRVEGQYHAIRLEYDRRDNVVLGTYLDEKLEPTVSVWRYTTWQNGYDVDRRVSERHLSQGRELVEVSWGFAEQRREWDENGVAREWAYFDARGRQVSHPDQCPIYAAQDKLSDLLRPVLECAPRDRRGTELIVLQLDSHGHLLSSAFPGLTDAGLRQCFEDKLRALELPAAEQACSRARVYVNFVLQRINPPAPKPSSAAP
jgi:hypothetical protein